MPFFITEQKGGVAVGYHEIAGVSTRATFSSNEEQVGRVRGDIGAEEGDSVVRLDADGAEQVLREIKDDAGHWCRQWHPL
jgi:hypothetical protein